jgi:hypothetical protein
MRHLPRMLIALALTASGSTLRLEAQGGQPAWNGSAALPIPVKRQFAHERQIEKTHDDESDSTTTSLEVPLLSKGKRIPLILRAGFVTSGKVVQTSPGVVTLLLTLNEELPARVYNATRDKLSEPARLEMVLDDSVRLGYDAPLVMSQPNPMSRGRVELNQSYVLVLDSRTFLRIATSRSIRGRMRGKSFVIEGETREALLDFASRMRPETAR